MLISLNGLRKFTLHATDGEIGKVENFLFDDEKWTVRYLIVNTGHWLTRKQVLISPIAIESVNPVKHFIQVSLTREQIKNSPDIDSEKPVTRQMETHFTDYYQWPYYWQGTSLWGSAPYPGGMLGPEYLHPPSIRPYSVLNDHGYEDPHLRSTRFVRGYGIEASDHKFGHVDDFVIDDVIWSIRYVVIDTTNFWPGKTIILSPHWVDKISWIDRKFKINLTEQVIKRSPEYYPNAPIHRAYEDELYDYYQRPKYWVEDSVSVQDQADPRKTHGRVAS